MMRYYLLLFIVFVNTIVICQTNIITKVGKFYGIQDKQTKKWILKPNFYKIEAFKNNKDESLYFLKGTVKEPTYFSLSDNSGKIITKYPIINVSKWNNLTGILKIDYQLIKSDEILQFSQLCYLDSSNQLVNYQYIDRLTDNIAVEKIKNKWAIYLNGTKISNHIYDTVYYLKSNAVIVKKNNLFGLISDSAEIILEPVNKTFDYINIKGDDVFIYGNETKTLTINDKKITCQNAIINNNVYFEKDSIYCFAIKNNNKWGIIRLDGKMQFECIYDSLIINNEHILMKQQNKWGFISLDKKYICKPKYDELFYNTCISTNYTLFEKINYNNTTNSETLTCNNSSPLKIPYIITLNNKFGVLSSIGIEMTAIVYDSINVIAFNKDVYIDSLRYYCFKNNEIDVFSSIGNKLTTRTVNYQILCINKNLQVLTPNKNCEQYQCTYYLTKKDAEGLLTESMISEKDTSFTYTTVKAKANSELLLYDFKTEQPLNISGVQNIIFCNNGYKILNTIKKQFQYIKDNNLKHAYKYRNIKLTNEILPFWNPLSLPNDSLCFIQINNKWRLFDTEKQTFITPNGYDSIRTLNKNYYEGFINGKSKFNSYYVTSVNNNRYDVIYPHYNNGKVCVVIKDAIYKKTNKDMKINNMFYLTSGKFNIIFKDSIKPILNEYVDDIAFSLNENANISSLINKDNDSGYTEYNINTFEESLVNGVAVKIGNKWSLVDIFSGVHEDGFDNLNFNEYRNKWLGIRNDTTYILKINNAEKTKIEVTTD